MKAKVKTSLPEVKWGPITPKSIENPIIDEIIESAKEAPESMHYPKAKNFEGCAKRWMI
jgi:hypothetical protein